MRPLFRPSLASPSDVAGIREVKAVRDLLPGAFRGIDPEHATLEHHGVAIVEEWRRESALALEDVAELRPVPANRDGFRLAGVVRLCDELKHGPYLEQITDRGTVPVLEASNVGRGDVARRFESEPLLTWRPCRLGRWRAGHKC